MNNTIIFPFYITGSWMQYVCYTWWIYPGRWCDSRHSLTRCHPGIDTCLSARVQQLQSSGCGSSALVPCRSRTMSLHCQWSYISEELGPLKRSSLVEVTFELRRQETKEKTLRWFVSLRGTTQSCYGHTRRWLPCDFCWHLASSTNSITKQKDRISVKMIHFL